jgi:hypothetical protein
MTKPKMPGEDQLIRGKQELAAGLKDIYQVMGNYLTTQMIEVKPGETLWHLAVTYLGDGQRWRELYMLNLDRMIVSQDQHRATTTPDLIYAGNLLRILLI